MCAVAAILEADFPACEERILAMWSYSRLITNALHERRAGRNQLEVRITNLWPNRMIGDAALPVEKRYTYATFQPFKPDDPLLESGLLGPVTLQTMETVILR
jgi:hypothetical protein